MKKNTPNAEPERVELREPEAWVSKPDDLARPMIAARDCLEFVEATLMDADCAREDETLPWGRGGTQFLLDSIRRVRRALDEAVKHVMPVEGFVLVSYPGVGIMEHTRWLKAREARERAR